MNTNVGIKADQSKCFVSVVYMVSKILLIFDLINISWNRLNVTYKIIGHYMTMLRS